LKPRILIHDWHWQYYDLKLFLIHFASFFEVILVGRFILLADCVGINCRETLQSEWGFVTQARKHALALDT
jgi:hypothetical protein